MIKSKAFWTGIGTLAISMLAAASSHELVKDNPDIASGVGVAIMVITFILGLFSPRPETKK